MLDKAQTRARVAARFARAFEERAGQLGIPDVDAETLGKHLEICTWNLVVRMSDAQRGFHVMWEYPPYRYRYTTKALSFEQNIRNPANPELATRLLKRELGLKSFVAMTPWEMFPERWEKTFEEVARRQLQKMTVFVDENSLGDGAVSCSKCKSRKTTWTSLQTRSADEPETLYFLCHSCGKRWKS